MHLIPIICAAALAVASAAPHPGSYSSANHYQFQRSSSSYRNNELQHKDEEAGAYGRIEDPDKYDKPLERSQYHQTSYHAPGTEDDYPPQSTGIKGGRPNSYPGHGHSSSYHRGSGGVIDSDYTSGDSFYQPGHGFHYPSGGHTYGYHHNHGNGYHHNHGYQHNHGFATHETSSQSSSSSITTNTQTQNQGKDDQLISLDQTFDYSKFKDQGFGKDYLENTEGQRITTPENIRPIFETTEEIPAQPDSFSQMGNNGRTIQQGQNSQQGQNVDLSIFGQNSQQGEAQTTTAQSGFNNNQQQQQIDMGQTFLQGQNIEQAIFGQNSQQGQTTTGQVSQQGQTIGQFAEPESDSQMGNNQDTQQQIDVGQSFLQGQNSQNGQSTIGQVPQQGQVFQIGQTTTGQQGQFSRGQVFQQGQTIGQFPEPESNSQMGNNQDTQQQIDIGQSFLQGQNSQNGQTTIGQIPQQGQVFQIGQTTTGQQGQFSRGQVSQQGQLSTSSIGLVRPTGQDHLNPIFEQIDQIGAMDSQIRDQVHRDFGSGTNQFAFGSNNYGGGRTYQSGNHEIMHHTTGYIKPKYETVYTHHVGIDEPDCQHKEHEEKIEEMVQEEAKTEQQPEEMTTQISFEEATTQTPAIEQNNNMEMMTQNKQDEMLEGNFQTITEKLEEQTTEKQEEPTTTEYYHHVYHQKHDKDYGKMEYDSQTGLTQQTQDHNQDFDQETWKDDGQQHQDTFGKFDYDEQHQEDLTQQTQDAFGRIEFDGDGADFTQQQETQHFDDLSQKQEKNDEDYGRLEFGGQQQEDLSQKNEDFGVNYGYRNSYGYSTSSSRAYSHSGSSGYGRISSSSDQDQNKDEEQLVQKVEQMNLEAIKEPEEPAIVVETEKPGFWKRLGGSITRTYESAKEKVKNNLG